MRSGPEWPIVPLSSVDVWMLFAFKVRREPPELDVVDRDGVLDGADVRPGPDDLGLLDMFHVVGNRDRREDRDDDDHQEHLDERETSAESGSLDGH